MLISHTKHFIYTKTAKTAGTSVEVYFEPYCMPDGEWSFSHERSVQVSKAGIVGHRGVIPKDTLPQWYHHMPAWQIRERIGTDIWNSYFKFCVVRDPFDKAVSAFHFMARDLASEACRGSLQNLKKCFEKWVANGKHLPVDRHQYVLDGSICMDHIIMYENLCGGIHQACKTLHIPFDPTRIPTLKVSGRRPKHLMISDYYNMESIRTVADVYQFEIEHFGYTQPQL
jgi:hypothetical protein